MRGIPHAALILFLAALLPRLILPLVGFSGITGDTTTYLPMAEGLCRGDGFTDEAGRLTAGRPPMYPIFLAGMLTLSGGSTTGVQILQAVVAASLAPLLAEILLPLLGRKRAFLAGLLYALDPVHIPTSAFLLTEAIGAGLLLLWVSAWIRTWRFGSTGSLAWAGLLGGAMIFQTMITLILHPLALVIFAFVRPRRWKAAILSVVIFAIPMIGWSVRNKMVLGQASAVRSGGFGFLLWATVNYDFPWLLSPFDSRGDYILTQEKHVLKHYAAGESHSVYMRKAVRRALDHPTAAAWRMTKALFWSTVEVPGAMKSLDDLPVAKWGLRLANIAVLTLAVAGAFTAVRSLEGRISLGVIGYFMLFHAPLYPIPRYFLPPRPLMALLAGYIGLRRQ